MKDQRYKGLQENLEGVGKVSIHSKSYWLLHTITRVLYKPVWNCTNKEHWIAERGTLWVNIVAPL